ncbi:hypothetical protein [Amycolatopsis sp. NPDC051102]|uniref:hypothetical protein n=1 Tax=Amycolatopsis sp. NPDC051102 TaxID=3155163 RepID=UPI00341275C1
MTNVSFEQLAGQFANLANQVPRRPLAKAVVAIEDLGADAKQALEQLKTDGVAIIGPNSSGQWVNVVNATITAVDEVDAAVTAQLNKLTAEFGALEQAIGTIANRISQGPVL